MIHVERDTKANDLRVSPQAFDKFKQLFTGGTKRLKYVEE
jgi:hypothetical protein